MKKPKITKGEWEYHKDFTAVTVKKGKMVADCFHAFDMEYEQNANGQAISAVPEMIDTLIELRVNMINLKQALYDDGYRGSAMMVSKDIAKIEQALKKAGCHE